MLAHPTCRSCSDDAEIDVGFLDPRSLAVEPGKNIDHRFKIMIDTDRDDLAVADFPYAIEARVHLWRAS